MKAADRIKEVFRDAAGEFKEAVDKFKKAAIEALNRVRCATASPDWPRH